MIRQRHPMQHPYFNKKMCSFPINVEFQGLWCKLAKTNIGRAENITTVPTNVTSIVGSFLAQYNLFVFFVSWTIVRVTAVGSLLRMLCFLCFSQLGVINFIKKTKIVWVLWLAERSVYMRVCKHGCDVTKMFCFSWANHTSANLKKFFSSKLNKFTLFKPIPSSPETWKIFTNKLCQFFFLLELTF